ncbi:MAG TPA: glycosyltransferase [Gemmatimonadales bacterium]|nr:glycosyltransferase [Gemmatimonadales bacterium]
MRIAVVGAGGAHKTEAAIVRAARSLGHHCRLVNVVGWSRYTGRLAGRAVRYLVDRIEPDFVLLTRHAIEVGEPALRRILRGREAVFWYFDAEPKPKVLALGRLVGRMYITCLGQVGRYRTAGVEQVRFLPQGVDPHEDRPAARAPRRYACDASFIGSGQYPYRYAVLRAVAATCRLQIRGPGWEHAPGDLPVAGGPIHGRSLRQAIRGAAISLGANARPEQDEDRASASNRMWKVMGCGGFYLGPYVPDIEWFAVGHRHCAWYRSGDEAAELVRHYLAAPEERRRIAEAGRAHALAHHTYAHRMRLLLADGEYQAGPPSDDGVVPELEYPNAR